MSSHPSPPPPIIMKPETGKKRAKLNQSAHLACGTERKYLLHLSQDRSRLNNRFDPSPNLLHSQRPGSCFKLLLSLPSASPERLYMRIRQSTVDLIFTHHSGAADSSLLQPVHMAFHIFRFVLFTLVISLSLSLSPSLLSFYPLLSIS